MYCDLCKESKNKQVCNFPKWNIYFLHLTLTVQARKEKVNNLHTLWHKTNLKNVIGTVYFIVVSTNI